MKQTLDKPLTIKVDRPLKAAINKIPKGQRSRVLKEILRLALVKRCQHCAGTGFSQEYNWTNYGFREDGSLGPHKEQS